MLRSTILVFLCYCYCSYAHAYPNYTGSAAAPVVRADAGPQAVHNPNADTEAAASAQTIDAGASAIAQRLNVLDSKALEHYAYEIGRPLLTKDYGEYTPLFAAVMPPRSSLLNISPAFTRDSKGHIRFHTGSTLAVLAI